MHMAKEPSFLWEISNQGLRVGLWTLVPSICGWLTFLVSQMVKNLPSMQETYEPGGPTEKHGVKNRYDWATNSSVQFSSSAVSDSLRPHGRQQARLPCPSPTPGVYSNSCPLSQWCHPTTSVIPFSSCLQSFPESGSFLMNQFFASGGQSIRASASAWGPSPDKKNLSSQRRENQRKKYSLLLEIRSTGKPERRTTI